MDRFIEQPLPSTLGRLTITWVFFDVGHHPSIENALPIACRIKAPIEIDIGASQIQPGLFGHLLQRFQSLWKQYHIRLIHGSDWSGREDIAIVVGDRNDFLSLLVLVARVPNAIAPFLATVLVPSPWRMLRSSC